MSLSFLQLLGVFCLSLLFSGLFSMLEAAVISQDKHRLQHLADEHDTRAVLMRHLLAHTDKLLSTLLLCNNLANVTCAAAATALATRLLPGTDAALVWVTLTVTFILLVFSEITPKVIGVRYASPIALTVARTLHILVRLLRPLTAVANFFSNCLLWLIGLRAAAGWGKGISLKELRAAVRAAMREGGSAHASDHYQIVEKTLRFNELRVETIMTPRRNIHGINLQDDLATIRRQIENTSYTKLPLYDGTLDNACGVVETIGAIKLVTQNALSIASLRASASAVDYIPAAAPVLQQLHKTRQRQQRLALVADGSGRVVGLLTFANFAAAIIGDEAPPVIQRRQDGAVILPGEFTLLQLEQVQPGTLPTDTAATTINGVILERLGTVPPVPLCMKINDWRIEILKTDDTSVQEVALFPPPAES